MHVNQIKEVCPHHAHISWLLTIIRLLSDVCIDVASDHFSLILTVCAAHFSLDCFMNLSQFNRGFAKRVLLKDGKVKMILTRANPQSACQLEKALSVAALYTCKESIIKTYQQKIVCLMTDKGLKIKTQMLMSSHETVCFWMRKTD